MNINELRKEIDKIDDELLVSFIRRMELVSKVGKIKKESNLEIEHKDREGEILFRLKEKAPSNLENYVDSLYKEIFTLSKIYQNSLSSRLNTPNQLNYALVGENIQKSYSKIIHNFFGNASYELAQLSKEETEKIIKEKRFKGLNLTMPYKESFIKYCDSLSPVAKEIGVINTLIKKNDSSLYGANTDYYGFSYLLEKENINVENKSILILGSGATAKTVKKVLLDKNAKEINFVSRNGNLNYSNVALKSETEVIINTTPNGMNLEDSSLINLADFPKLESVVDVIYSPFMTKLLLQAKELNLNYANGLKMLIAQAKRSHELFFLSPVGEEKIYETEAKIKEEFLNIVLVGMSGSGKTTLGKEIAKRLNREFIDIDEKIEKEENRKIKEIFFIKGENYFRKKEAQLIKNISANNGLVIASGGGSILKKENVSNLSYNGVIIFINRDINKLETINRPLIKSNDDLVRLFNERLPIYKSIASKEIENNLTINQAENKIIEAFYEIINN